MVASITSLIQSADFPLLTAFLLGLITIINPCQIAISTSALGYLSRNTNGSTSRIRVMRTTAAYALGRSLTYTVLGWLLTYLIKQGMSVDGISNLLSKAESFLPYILISTALFLLYRTFFHHEHEGDSCRNSTSRRRYSGTGGAFMLGMSLAFAFCPESALFFFGMLLPLSVNSSIGILLPPVYALAATIPIIFISLIMHTTVSRIHTFTTSVTQFQRIINITTAILLILFAILCLLHK